MRIHLISLRPLAPFLAGPFAAMLIAGLPLAPAHAARPMITDDARIVDAQACQLESWVRHDRASSEAWALPACNFTGNLELSLGAAHTQVDGQSQSNNWAGQAKTVIKPLQADGWGVAIAAGTVQYQHTGKSDWYANLPASISLRNDTVLVHANLGWLRDGNANHGRLTWGLGTETQLTQSTWMIAETFGQDQGKPSVQIGLRHWLLRDRIQLDATYGNRLGSGTGQPWLSLGLRLLSVPFLP